MKFVIVDPFSKKPIRIIAKKQAGDSHLEFVRSHQDGREEPLVVVSAKGGGKIGLKIPQDHPDIEIEGLDGLGQAWVPPLDEDGKPLTAAGDDLRNWELVKDGKLEYLRVTHPTTKQEVRLAVEPKPGPKTPTEGVYEILGQPEMVFSVAYALANGKHSLLTGPTGTGKTTIYRWFAHILNRNYVTCPIARGTEGAHLVGEYMPTGAALFEWMDGPVTEAGRLAQDHPTILVLDELNRIGNIAELARIYSVLDDTKMLELKERRTKEGFVERIDMTGLVIGATSNPSDDERADYVGVQDMDPALISRFPIQPTVDYPSVPVEVEALLGRVPDLDRQKALQMCHAAKRIREAEEIRFPMSFRELVAWAEAEPLFGMEDAARVTVVNKAPITFRPALEGYLSLT